MYLDIYAIYIYNISHIYFHLSPVYNVRFVIVCVCVKYTPSSGYSMKNNINMWLKFVEKVPMAENIAWVQFQCGGGMGGYPLYYVFVYIDQCKIC
jgi:hypothetical protein